ncbi:IucA/IucC family C-terminal-domain containing protein [Paenibacillus sp. XY044]|uniref:IucA/IucC family C-terminal-domain containing protein n=1 Tax=Paenibacillus sp. XY044 TaxID=2026089 RepID=UPI000B97F369|nr:IucA/IucC family C-terminal-domain containing protein [Paenibacillus sp. XY044]OZB95306.1 hypothetical protein CJP46_16660 [Paenibacillus sp. XY044]
MSRPITLTAVEAAEMQNLFGLCSDALSAETGKSASISAWTRASTLLDHESCTAYLDELAARLGTNLRPIAASMLAKRYAAAMAAPFFHALTCYDKALELPVESVVLRSGKKHWLEGITVSGRLSAIPAGESREDWRLRTAEQFVRLHLRPLWQSFSRCSGLPETILWENMAVRIYSLYEKKIPKIGKVPAAKAADDFRFLLHALPAEAFGQKRQPIARFYGGEWQCDTALERKPAVKRIRQTCCLYYRVSLEGEYCDACPKTKRR